MGDTCCEAYNNYGTIQMEQFLYHAEYSMYNKDANLDHPIDDFVYYQLFDC